MLVGMPLLWKVLAGGTDFFAGPAIDKASPVEASYPAQSVFVMEQQEYSYYAQLQQSLGLGSLFLMCSHSISAFPVVR